MATTDEAPAVRYRFIKGADDTWCIAGPIEDMRAAVRSGDPVIITKKSGDESKVKLTGAISDGDHPGEGVTRDFVNVQAPRTGRRVPPPQTHSAAVRRAYGARRRQKACITGGNCSSFGNGRSCGGYGCDGF